MRISQQAQWILNTLNEHGFAAYVVGGCVRDALRGCDPTDWDIATNAKPEQIKACFSDCPLIDTGIRHGTVTVLVDHVPYEITTFRVDGSYTDGRHPDQVVFVNQLYEDLARRDFTINAMAYHPETGLVDHFHGRTHLAEKKIVCVGVPAERFQEDALRILRAVRFASVLGFTIDTDTQQAMDCLTYLLDRVSVERITQELMKALCGTGIASALQKHRNIFLQILPELSRIGCPEQWQFAVRSVQNLPDDFALRLAALLFFCADAGEEQAVIDCTFQRLRCSNRTRNAVVSLVRCRKEPISAEDAALKWLLYQHGEEIVQQLIVIRRAIAAAKGELYAMDILDQAQVLLAQIIQEKQCYRLRDLAVNGADLILLGVPAGKRIGEKLQWLLQQVIAGSLPNQRDILLQAIQKHREE